MSGMALFITHLLLTLPTQEETQFPWRLQISAHAHTWTQVHTHTHTRMHMYTHRHTPRCLNISFPLSQDLNHSVLLLLLLPAAHPPLPQEWPLRDSNSVCGASVPPWSLVFSSTWERDGICHCLPQSLCLAQNACLARRWFYLGLNDAPWHFPIVCS